MPDVPTFGQHLRALMKRYGVMAKQVAAEMEISSQSFARYTSTDRMPQVQTLRRLAGALTRAAGQTVSVEQLMLAGEDEKQATLTSPVLSAEDAAAAAEGAVPVSEAKQRHINVIRGLRDEVFARIELELEQVVGRALAGGHSSAEPRRASRTAARR